MSDNLQRCAWAQRELDIQYHDTEWGRPEHDDRELFERLILEGMQAGLSWSLILKKRQAFRDAFDDFDAERIAAWDDDAKRAELMQNTGIVRNRLKILAVMKNARAYLKLREQHGSLDDFFWGYVDGKPIINAWARLEDVPAHTELSDRIAKDLKRMGFTFVGTTIIYAFMQSVGMVYDHLVTCFLHGEGGSV